MAITLDGLSALTSINQSTSTVGAHGGGGTDVTLACRLTSVEGSANVWQCPCVIMSGTMGETDIYIKVPKADARRAWVVAAEKGYWSPDGTRGSWTLCDSISEDATYTISKINGPVATNTLWFARDRRVGTVQTGAWLETIADDYPSLVRPVHGFADFVVDTYSSQTNELGGTVAACPLYGALLTNSNGLRKPRICITAGVHACEDYANTVYEYAVEYLLSEYMAGTTFARNLLSRFDWLLVPLVNAPGRNGGHCRSQFVTTASTHNDCNRHFSDVTDLFETITKPRDFFTRQMSPGSSVGYIDYHTQYFATVEEQVAQGFYTSLGSPLETTWITTYQTHGAYGNYGANPGGTLIGWFVDDREVLIGEVIEQNEEKSKTEADAQLLGTYGMLTFNDLLVAGEFGANALVNTNGFARRAA